MNNTLTLSPAQLQLSKDKQQLRLLISDVAGEVSNADIIALVKDSDYNNFKFSKAGLQEAIQHYEGIKRGVPRHTKLQSVIIADRRDAQLIITFDPQKITAKAQITSPFAGKKITYQQLMDGINEQHISIGISHSAINQIIEKSALSKPGTAYQIIIAKGIQAVDGYDSQFECLLDSPKEILKTAINLDYGSFDMNNISKLISVQPGEQLMRRIPACNGHDGITVTGEIIEHTPGNEFPFNVGHNTAICDSDENILIATAVGTPIISNRGMEVDQLLMMDSLNPTSGCVNHTGSLIIAGDIRGCKEIIATGDITVIGFIESSKVQCGGDLFVTKGILGHPVKGDKRFSSEINCKGSLFANFIQYATVDVGYDLNIKHQLLHCYVQCKGYINVKDEDGKKGTIFGGVLSAEKGICTVTLGAPVGIKTTINLIGAYESFLDNKKRINLELDLNQEKLRTVLSAQRKLTNAGNSEKLQLLDERLTLTIKEIKNQLIALTDARENNYIAIQEYFSNTHVLALKALHSDVTISIGEHLFRSSRSYCASDVRVKNDLLVIDPYQ
ncbi:MAG: hypothetical protein ACJAT7_001206 [Psychromonas sp.]|jgi:uncharacterized protein (DUF342 family)|uniref:DUF342 domain-containing protein n=1 Tax=Psychromonas sp. TaxID=1884585 RepID=UPI0039E5F8BE